MVVVAGDDSRWDRLPRGGCPVALTGEVDFEGLVSPGGCVSYGGGRCSVPVVGEVDMDFVGALVVQVREA